MRPRQQILESSVPVKRVYDTESDEVYHTALMMGSYHLTGGESTEEGEQAYVLIVCPSCGCSSTARFDTQLNAFLPTCEDCGYSIAMITNHKAQLNKAHYEDLIVSDEKTLKEAIYYSMMISIVGTTHFFEEHVQGAGRRRNFIDMYMDFINPALTVSMFRNEASYEKIQLAIEERGSPSTTEDYNLGASTLLSKKNLDKYIETLKTGNINILYSSDAGIPKDMLFITTEHFPIFIPLSIFKATFLQEILAIKGQRLVETREDGSSKIPAFVIPRKPTATQRLLHIEDMNNLPEDLQCKGCGTFVSKVDIKKQICNVCNGSLLAKMDKATVPAT